VNWRGVFEIAVKSDCTFLFRKTSARAWGLALALGWVKALVLESPLELGLAMVKVLGLGLAWVWVSSQAAARTWNQQKFR
jgi:hypothetical protein